MVLRRSLRKSTVKVLNFSHFQHTLSNMKFSQERPARSGMHKHKTSGGPRRPNSGPIVRSLSALPAAPLAGRGRVGAAISWASTSRPPPPTRSHRPTTRRWPAAASPATAARLGALPRPVVRSAAFEAATALAARLFDDPTHNRPSKITQHLMAHSKIQQNHESPKPESSTGWVGGGLPKR